MNDPAEARRVAETAARDGYGRLVAYLASRSRDVAGAEDALGEAFLAALETWPIDGVPDRPDAWLLTVARRHLIDHARHEQTRHQAVPRLRAAAERKQAELDLEAADEAAIPDERLKLMFACAHPAIDAGARTPLMLQAILGLDATRIASAFLVSPATMSQRLVRAKAKIREAGVPFAVPESANLADRLAPVLEAVYAAYGTGWEDLEGVDPRRQGLAAEAVWLARILVGLVPEAAEARGLLALLLHCEARRPARRSPSGDYVPLADQDVRLWSIPLIKEAERELAGAASLRSIGRFQLEAAIQSVHAGRAFGIPTRWEAVDLLHEELVRRNPTLGALVARAATRARTQGPAEGLALLEAIDARSIVGYQPFWAVRAHLLAESGRFEASRAAYARAIGLSEDPRVRDFLIRNRERLLDRLD